MTSCVIGNCNIRDAISTRLCRNKCTTGADSVGTATKNITSTACYEPVRDKSREYVAISNAFGVTSAIFLTMRFAYKLWDGLDICLDDWFALIAIIIGVPSTVINAHGVAPNGMGRDAWTLTFDNLTSFARFFYILEIIYLAEISLLKLSLLLFYIRIFPGGDARRLLRGTVAFVSVFGVIFVSMAVFQCTPIDTNWRSWDGVHPGRCLDINALAWSNAAISITLDVWMLAIPLWQLRRLNLDWRRKVGVALMFCVGTL